MIIKGITIDFSIVPFDISFCSEVEILNQIEIE